ncbi:MULTISPECIES: response regulator transcription factor [Bradyrhizobium]|jgi:two-component system OmpR family response regulator|uniref:Response regulator transcription factor n=1 Tax=Bradyrhizobium denitrificans TaxID=2734912 RepID=A0ABS5GHI6_9BRAD|nr:MULTISPECIES: response regulator transcription factor [Bradyrhizobium]RTL97719.1 MAG: response regulator transcription factor [Bradyrhizobiaceae bacterium]MBR1140484.1 response regulator transcription factor [Bradyrhizobium denitrificans]MCL8488955.1 response regulator transcription factor [Bradyrhizobium denitrificans]MDU0954963.1 response regulator transcription factor [Bradyrhizobium sp.]MDU1496621.1 response regulator transcription factor [Bradyrhizobium sp.]
MPAVMVLSSSTSTSSLMQDQLNSLRYSMIHHSCYDVGWTIQPSALTGIDALIILLDHQTTDGIALIDHWRGASIGHPVLAAGTSCTKQQIVDAIDHGADDYISLPCGLMELATRLSAMLRRCRSARKLIRTIDHVSVDEDQMQVIVSGIHIHVTPFEYRLLLALMQRPNSVLSIKELRKEIYGEDSRTPPGAAEMLVARLRRKVGHDFIKTQRGAGYYVVENPTSMSANSRQSGSSCPAEPRAACHS